MLQPILSIPVLYKDVICSSQSSTVAGMRGKKTALFNVAESAIKILEYLLLFQNVNWWSFATLQHYIIILPSTDW